MSQVYDIANDYVERYAALNPLSATSIGVPGYDDKMSDFSPQGAEANADLKRQTIAALNAATVEGERDRIARDAMLDDLQTDLDTHDAGEHLRSLRVLGSAFQGIRQVFDLMPRDTEEDWRNIAARLALVPQGMESYRQSLQEGVRQSKTSSRRQAAGCAEQAQVWMGAGGSPSFFHGLLDSFDGSGVASDALRRDITAGADAAASAYADMGRFLTDEYMLGAVEQDGVGEERYALSSRAFNGTDMDFVETYNWGWEQLRWVESEMAKTSENILPGAGIEAAKQFLETDPDRAIEGVDAFQN
jgi:uncharacterized protein (DUF885 family)